jgi:hypothetical protein
LKKKQAPAPPPAPNINNQTTVMSPIIGNTSSPNTNVSNDLSLQLSSSTTTEPALYPRIQSNFTDFSQGLYIVVISSDLSWAS